LVPDEHGQVSAVITGGDPKKLIPDKGLTVFLLGQAVQNLLQEGISMKFIYPRARVPENGALLAKVEKAAGSLYDKLRALDVASLPISDYNKKYLNERLSNLQKSLQIYAYILTWSIGLSGLPEGDIVFCDYGGGTGIMSLLAVELK
jgi:hypothetical protein